MQALYALVYYYPEYIQNLILIFRLLYFYQETLEKVKQQLQTAAYHKQVLQIKSAKP